MSAVMPLIDDVLAGRARWALVVGDCRAALATIPNASVDAMPCDPPYELGFMGKRWDASGVAFDIATWREAARIAKPGAHLAAFGGARTFHRLTCAIEDAGWEIRDCLSWLYGQGFPKSLNGLWGGTALKPAWEPIVLARKPIEGTVAKTFAAHGTGGLGIEACRIEGPPSSGGATATGMGYHGDDRARVVDRAMLAGRWPANVCLDEEAAEALDEQSGVASPKPQRIGRKGGHTGAMAFGSGGDAIGTWPADPGGGASRFFYVAKPSTAEREEGTEQLPKRSAGDLTDREEGTVGISSPRAGAGRSSSGRANFHPTVKPIDLCRWLIRLITPPGGVVVDMFCGSGTMGAAAMLEGVRYIGCELTEDYVPIATARISHWANVARRESAQQSLFGKEVA